jgi:hypothetical protein
MSGPILKRVKNQLKKLWSPPKSFEGSDQYWKSRYEHGGTSGSGSYGHLAEFKAEILNAFVRDESIKTVIEFGCGDGNQLASAKYPNYLGFDISEESIKRCRTLFANDKSKSFKTVGQLRGDKAELTMSLDVIFHLTEDSVYEAYMKQLFEASSRYVIIYSSNAEPKLAKKASHVRHRAFTEWVAANKPEWKLVKHIPNRYPFDGTENTSFADFYIYKK